MTSHCRNRRTFAGQTESPSRQCMGIRKSAFPITRSLASLGFRLACSPSRANACLIRLSQHLRVNAFVSRPNGMAVRGSSVLGLTIMRSFVRVGVVERAVAVTQRQPACANAAGHRTSIPFGHHAIPETFALADDIALSEPPDICGPNGISASPVYGVTEAWVSDSTFPCESGVPFGVSSLASHRLPRPSLPALASQRMRFSAKRNGGARVVSAGVDDNAVVRQGRGLPNVQRPSPNNSPYAQTLPDNAPPFRLAITPYRKRLPLPMTSHYRNRRTFAGQTESPSRKCMG